MYNPPMQGIPWSTIALGSLLLIAARSTGGQEVKSPQPEKSKPPVKMEQRGRIVGIGGVFFKSANRDQMREWYSKHLGLADKGQGAMLPWREHDDPQKEHVTVWTVFPASTKYFDPSPAPFMINYIVDDMDALLDRLKQEGVKIDAKRPWFPHRGHQSSRLCRFSSTGSTRSPEAEEVLRRQDVRWRADGRCTQSIRRTLRVARPRSSLRTCLARCIPNRCISSIPPCFL